MGLWERGFASVYDGMNSRMERGVLGRRRAALIAPIDGSVVEIGAGSGANIAHYRAATRVVATEPSAPMRERLHVKVAIAKVPIEIVDAPAERLPFDDATFDAAVGTLVLCTVDDPAAALAELRRVMKPGGRFSFIEHGGGADGRRGVWQHRLEPVWKRVACGCHLTRDAPTMIAAAGFDVIASEEFNVRQTPPVLLPFVQGTAVR